jgi:hypothetical protein
MKQLSGVVLFALALVFVVVLAGTGPRFAPIANTPAVVHAASPNVLTLDVAVDCRTVVAGTNRGDTFFINGKLFPGGTLLPGAQTNDPTMAVNGVQPIGDYAVRGQHAISLVNGQAIYPFPPEIVAAYQSIPLGHATAYFLLNGGKTALITEGYDLPPFRPTHALMAIVGGIGGYSGVAGDILFNILGTNGTGCANSRAIFNIQPGSVRGNPNQ